MIPGARTGVLGGTLDPIHLGHLDAAFAARDALALDRVLIIPSHVPPHRLQPVSSAFHRFAMAALAVNGINGFEISDEELCSPGPSYTADTLTRLHARGVRASQIFFITGADAFAEIETWSRFPEVLDLAHFVVISRSRFPASALPGRMPSLAARMGTLADVRQREGQASIFLVDAKTRDISSTDIRRRLSRHESIAGLVPPAVEAHILQHRLYTGAPHDGATRSTADHLHGQN